LDPCRRYGNRYDTSAGRFVIFATLGQRGLERIGIIAVVYDYNWKEAVRRFGLATWRVS
jgi:hypothetical protein